MSITRLHDLDGPILRPVEKLAVIIGRLADVEDDTRRHSAATAREVRAIIVDLRQVRADLLADTPPAGPPPAAGVERTRAAFAHPNRGRRAHNNKTRPDGTRHCPRCDKTLPLEAFDLKDKTSGIYRYCCRTCWKAYQRERYVAANKQAIIVEVLDGDRIVGAICNACRKPIEIGQLITATAILHQDCADQKALAL